MSATLWTSTAAAAATRGQATKDWAATGVSIDSRAVAPGDLFVALKGPTFDGHDFVAGALKAGAAAAVAARRPADIAPDAPLLLVGDTMAALEDLGRTGRARATAKVVGVTGSVGKTGTKEALKLVLSRQGETHASVGSLNNHWGVPLTLARLPETAAYAVLEMGMNHAGELAVLSRMGRPHVAVITTVEAAHMEYFASVEAIADAKAEIMDGLEPDGTVVLNRDNPQFERLAAHAARRGIGTVLDFGADPKSRIRLIEAVVEADGSTVEASIDGRRVRYRLGAPGRHWVMNSLAVLGAVQAIEADVEAAASTLADLTPPKGRGQRHMVSVPGGTALLIDDSYNANPASMRAAFATLSAVAPGAGGRRIAALGDMRELGKEADALHAGLVPDLIAAGVDLVFTAGVHMAALRDALPERLRAGHAETSDALVPMVTAALKAGDTILVKGSAGSRMGAVVSALLDNTAEPRRERTAGAVR